MALPVFGYFMEQVLADPKLAPLYIAKFGNPKEKLDRQWDCNTYMPHYSDSDSLSIFLSDSLTLNNAEAEIDIEKLLKE